MLDLLSKRITPSTPLINEGNKFCGPFYIKHKGQRIAIYHKCYVAIFTCFVTKAIHLKVVTDLTSEVEITTLKIFINRRCKKFSI